MPLTKREILRCFRTAVKNSRGNAKPANVKGCEKVFKECVTSDEYSLKMIFFLLSCTFFTLRLTEIPAAFRSKATSYLVKKKKNPMIMCDRRRRRKRVIDPSLDSCSFDDNYILRQDKTLEEDLIEEQVYQREGWASSSWSSSPWEGDHHVLITALLSYTFCFFWRHLYHDDLWDSQETPWYIPWLSQVKTQECWRDLLLKTL